MLKRKVSFPFLPYDILEQIRFLIIKVSGPARCQLLLSSKELWNSECAYLVYCLLLLVLVITLEFQFSGSRRS